LSFFWAGHRLAFFRLFSFSKVASADRVYFVSFFRLRQTFPPFFFVPPVITLSPVPLRPPFFAFLTCQRNDLKTPHACAPHFTVQSDQFFRLIFPRLRGLIELFLFDACRLRNFFRLATTTQDERVFLVIKTFHFLSSVVRLSDPPPGAGVLFLFFPVGTWVLFTR